MLYFAYGSNLLSARLRARAPSARAVGVAALPRRELRFHKRSRDGSAKCDAVPTGRAGDAVHGAVFELDESDWPALDRAEGRGAGYERSALEIEWQGAPVEAYLAQAGFIEPALLPYSWYVELVVAGARQHGLPAEYVARLERQASMPDPDREREARERVWLSEP